MIPLLLLTLAASDGYTLDPTSELVVRIPKTGIAAALGHNHLVRATQANGRLQWDPQAPEKTTLSLEVLVGSLIADEPALRKKYGEKTVLGPADRKKLTATMVGPEQLDAKRHPSIKFESTRVYRDAQGQLIVWGRFTLRGVTRAVTLPVTVTQGGDRLTGSGRFSIRTSEYGIEPYRAALGTIANSDEVELILRLVWKRQR